MAIKYTTKADDVLDLICDGMNADFDEILKRNGHLAQYGPYLPAGLTIIFDDDLIKDKSTDKADVIEQVELWQ